LEVTILPVAAQRAGATWNLTGGASHPSGYTQPDITPGTYTLEFSSVAGFQAPGNFNVTVNGGLQTDVTANYSALGAPFITSPLAATGTNGTPLNSYQITAQNNPEAFAALYLPPGLALTDPKRGTITGTPAASGSFASPIDAVNTLGADVKELIFYIAPEITSPGVASVSVGQALNYQITTGSTDIISSFGFGGILPNGLSGNPARGILSGTAQQAGLFNLTVSAVNVGGTNTVPLTLLVNQSGASGIEGEAFSGYQVAGGGTDNQVFVSNLPPGLTLDPESGMISGTATESGSFTAIVTVSSTGGTTVSTLLVTINPVLGISQSGSGTVTDVATGQVLSLPIQLIGVSGASYTLLASAGPGSFFGGWTGDAWTDDPVQITLVNNLNTEAIFSTFASAKGNYSGLVGTIPATISGAGSIQLTLDGGGKYTGKMLYGGVAYSMRGAFDQMGSSMPVLRSGGPTVQLHLNTTGGFPEVTGSAIASGSVAVILAKEAAFSKAQPFGAPGRYTALIQPTGNDAGAPQGIGYGAVTVSPLGKVTFTGVLNDGTKVTFGSTISADQTWPFYASPYKSTKFNDSSLKSGGFISGWVTFLEQTGTSEFNGVLDWGKTQTTDPKAIYPSGFQTQTALIGSLYELKHGESILDFPDTTNNALLTFGFTPSLSGTITISPRNTVVAPVPDKLTLKFNLTDGLFSGRVMEDGSLSPYGGAVFQTGTYGGGLILSGTTSDPVMLDPSP
jgi:hypothetical protein